MQFFANLVEFFLLASVEAFVKSDQRRIFLFQSIEPSLMEGLPENEPPFEGGQVRLARAELGLRIGERLLARCLEIFKGGLLRIGQIKVPRQPIGKSALMRVPAML